MQEEPKVSALNLDTSGSSEPAPDAPSSGGKKSRGRRGGRRRRRGGKGGGNGGADNEEARAEEPKAAAQARQAPAPGPAAVGGGGGGGAVRQAWTAQQPQCAPAPVRGATEVAWSKGAQPVQPAAGGGFAWGTPNVRAHPAPFPWL